VAPGPLPETQCAMVIIDHLSNDEDEEAVNDEIKREVEFDIQMEHLKQGDKLEACEEVLKMVEMLREEDREICEVWEMVLLVKEEDLQIREEVKQMIELLKEEKMEELLKVEEGIKHQSEGDQSRRPRRKQGKKKKKKNTKAESKAETQQEGREVGRRDE
jgi:hypothetical protein